MSTSSLTEGCVAVLRLLAPRVPDVFLICGATSFGIGIYAFDPRAIWLYGGVCCLWLAVAIETNQKRQAGK